MQLFNTFALQGRNLNTATTSIKNLFIPMLGRSTKYMGMVMNGRLSETELTLKQFILLVHVKEEGRTQSDLVMITERDKGSLTRLIQSMERKGFVVRKGSKSDKRINIVESTTLGRRVLKKAEKIVIRTFDELRAGISPKEEKMVIDIAERLMANAQRLLEEPRIKIS